jgi:hypothetical protein
LIPASGVAISAEGSSTIADSEVPLNAMNDLGADETKTLAIESTTDQADWPALVSFDQLAWVASGAGTIALGLAGWFAFARIKPGITLRLRRTGRLARLS